MADSSPLPISVVLPTRNARTLLPRHVQAMRAWLGRVEEVIVVDSESTDGTPEFLREHLSHPRARFLSHPPGLYESWNFGIGQAQSEFTYISTAGDTVTLATLERLAAIAREHSADAVVSLPRFVGPGARRMHGRWPLERFIARARLRAPRLLTGLEVFLWSALHAPGGLLGSSASNLYRTRFLQAHPFPACYRRVGDTGWAVENAFHVRFVVAPGLESEFFVHAPADAPSPERPGETRRRLLSKAREVFAEQLNLVRPPPHADAFVTALDEFWRASEALLDANECYQEWRRQSRAALLDPRVWRARAKRFSWRRRTAAVRESILARLASLCGDDA